MNKYKIKHFSGEMQETIERYTNWVTTRNHITITNVIFTHHNEPFNIIVTYVEETYEG